MTAVEVRDVEDRETLEQCARAIGAAVTVTKEDWESITYEAQAEHADGTRTRYRYRYMLPVQTALRRWHRTFIVGMHHAVGGADCHHVRYVILPSGSPYGSAARQWAALIAGAVVETERRHTCGATAALLTPYVIERAADWTG